MNESAFARDYSSLLRGAGAKVLALTPENFGGSGWPDRYICHWRFTGWLENKKNNNSCSTLQRIMLRDLTQRGERAMVVRWRGDEVTFETPDERVACTVQSRDLKTGEDWLSALEQAWPLVKEML